MEKPGATLPDRLRQLGFELDWRGGAWAIVPPTCLVPAGPFIMGASPGHRSGFRISEYEMPRHPVVVATFAMATYPVTVAEYACAVQAGSVREPVPPEWDAGQYSWQAQRTQLDAPVVYVSWSDAREYAHWLSALTGRLWRLPTEAEWEKAARGTDERMFPWGDEWDATCANTAEGGVGHLTPVGLYPRGASPYGVQDLAGNVYEWCSSRSWPYPYRADDGREGGNAPFERVLRGGCWDVDAWNARTIGRNQNDEPYDTFAWAGFRLVDEYSGESIKS